MKNTFSSEVSYLTREVGILYGRSMCVQECSLICALCEQVIEW